MKIIRLLIVSISVISLGCAMDDVSDVAKSAWSLSGGRIRDGYEGKYKGQCYNVFKIGNGDTVVGNVNKGTSDKPNYETLSFERASLIWALFEEAEKKQNN